MNVDEMIDEVIGREGGYSNHPSDRGGPTRWGVTQAVARKHGYQGNMRDFPREQAVAIYRTLYYDKPDFDLVAPFSTRVANELFDTGINMGPIIGAQFLQEALNALNGQGVLWADISVDGDIGPATIRSLDAYFRRTRTNQSEADKVIVMLRMLDCQQGARYISISKSRPKNEDFIFGWFRTRIQQA